MQDEVKLRPKLLAVAVAAALAGVAPTVGAAPAVSLTALANTTDSASSGPNVADIMTNPPANGGDFYATPGTYGNSLFYHTYGILNAPSGPAYFGARVSGDGTFYGRTSATYTDTYKNLSGSAQNVTFGFSVDYGEVGLYGSGTGFADLLLSVKFGVNGGTKSEVARSHGRVDTGTAPICSTDGLGSLASYLSCSGSSATGAGGPFSAMFANLGAGDELNIQYDIVATVKGDFTPSNGCFYGYGADGYGPVGQEGVATFAAAGPEVPGQGPFQCVDFNAIARSGDPPFTFGQLGPTVTADAAVPEPGSLALMGLALGGLALARRRRQGKPAS